MSSNEKTFPSIPVFSTARGSIHYSLELNPDPVEILFPSVLDTLMNNLRLESRGNLSKPVSRSAVLSIIFPFSSLFRENNREDRELVSQFGETK